MKERPERALVQVEPATLQAGPTDQGTWWCRIQKEHEMTTGTMDRRDRSAQIIPIVAIAAGVALAAVVALAAFGPGRGSEDAAGAPPVPPTETAAATPVPTDVGSDATPIRVDLANATGADIHVDVADQTGLLVGARSGTPGEGMSVEPYTLVAENVDATTLKLTWVDFPIDNALALSIDESDGGIRVLLVQPAPTGPADSIGFDRELILSFSRPISAGRVETFLQEGLDTPG
jgi:hypothetical protein